MVSMIACCEKCDSIHELIIDSRSHEKLSNYICDVCKSYNITEKRDKKLNQLLKRNWFDIFKLKVYLDNPYSLLLSSLLF